MNDFQKKQAAKILACYGVGTDLVKGGEGSRGGKVIGHTRSGKPIYSHRTVRPYDDEHYSNFSHDDIQDAIDHHEGEFLKLRDERREHLRDKKTTKLSPKEYKARSSELNNNLHEHYSSIASLSQRSNYDESKHTSEHPYLSYDYKEKELTKKKAPVK